jgi:abhydrolase domain-containing protein 6
MKRWKRGLVALLSIGLLAFAAVYAWRPAWLVDAEFSRLAWLAGVHKTQIETAGHRWSYYEGGQGPTVVLIHGFTGSKENWLQFARFLTPTHRVIIPDLPGWGESQRIDGEDYDVRAQAQRLGTFIEALKLDRIDLVGHSMGGHIVGVYAADHSAALHSLALVDNAGVHFTENDFARRVLAGATPFNVSTVAELDAFLNELFVHPPWLPARLKQVLVDRNIAGHAFHERLLAQLRMGPDAFLLESRLPDIQAPTWVFWCRADRLLDVSSVDTIKAQLPGIESTIIDECGHMPMMEVPQPMANAYLEFLARHPDLPRGG